MTPRLVVLGLALGLGPTASTEPAMPPGFVYLRAVDPTIVQEMRYASAENFTGQKLPGYEAGECVLKKGAADALKKVQADLAKSGLGLKVFDCYRPKRAVAAMADWAAAKGAGADKKNYFPSLDKAKLHSLGYIARKSAHSSGIAVDLTLVRLAGQTASPQAMTGSCTGPASDRSSADEVDMGTAFDCFDRKSHTASSTITADQRRSRNALLAAMQRHGFANYSREWWHFTYGKAAGGHDFEIGPFPGVPPR